MGKLRFFALACFVWAGCRNTNATIESAPVQRAPVAAAAVAAPVDTQGSPSPADAGPPRERQPLADTPSRESPPEPTGDDPCIREPLEHALGTAREMLKNEGQGGATQASNFSRGSLADVDGDGTAETLFVEEYMGTANNPHFLYLSGGGCLRYGGVVWAHGESLQVLREKKSGLRMLQTFGSDGCAGLEGTVRQLAWADGAFVVAREIRCGCPDLEPNARRDPACP